jgi:putative transposase
MFARRAYATDLYDEEWRILEPLVPEAKPGDRPRTH